MRTLYLILLCLIVAASCSAAKPRRDGGSNDSPPAVQSHSDTSSSSDTKDKPSNTSSSSEPKDKPAEPTHYSPPSDPPAPKPEPKPDPPAPRYEPKPDPPKPSEDSSSRSNSNSYTPAPAPSVSETSHASSDRSSSAADSSNGISRKEAKARERAADTPAPTAPPPAYHPRNSSDSVGTQPKVVTHTPKPSPATTPARDTAYRPSAKPANDTNKPPVRTTDGPAPAYHPANSLPSAAVQPSEPAVPMTAPMATGYRPSGTTSSPGTANGASNSTGYSPRKEATIPKRQAELAKQPPQALVTSPKGYTPSATVRKPNPPSATSGRTPGVTVHRPGSVTNRTGAVGYSPRGTTYTVGYHPTTPTRPKGYTPPIFSGGEYRYPSRPSHRPFHYGHWAFDYSPGFSWWSLYRCFGIFPFIEVTQIEECQETTVDYVSEPLYATGRTYYGSLRYAGLDEALADIRSAWIGGRFDLIERHVQPQSRIAVLTDGKYDYTISSEDYLSMTEDAMADLNTVSFVWDKVRERRDGAVMAFGEHSCRSIDRTQTVFVSYTLKKVGLGYYITEVGSSAKPLN